ncbi:hypothetical protein ARMGADRAFT_1035800 [Armillaria gallica]|uniref:Uncharacterized protein n=1 Tax=Armillaria gallica TaxID=47427 RepID=A0A2H3CSN9_ARMGA|nr:hypothetical protein ARMGADRAFT_1035800 [Armillaria gallica]
MQTEANPSSYYGAREMVHAAASKTLYSIAEMDGMVVLAGRTCARNPKLRKTKPLLSALRERSRHLKMSTILQKNCQVDEIIPRRWPSRLHPRKPTITGSPTVFTSTNGSPDQSLSLTRAQNDSGDRKKSRNRMNTGLKAGLGPQDSDWRRGPSLLPSKKAVSLKAISTIRSRPL